MFSASTTQTTFGASSQFGTLTRIAPKAPPKPLETFKPTKASLEFWEFYFSKFSEVTMIDYLNALIPLLESETSRKFTDNQLLVLIDVLNYESNFKVNKYES